MAKDVYKNELEDWSERDSLPTKDPIGDTDDEWVDGYNSWKDAQKAYENTMKNRLIKPEGEVFGYTKDQIGEFEKYMNPEPKCNCGTFATYGKVPVDAHRPYCALRKADSSI